MRHARHYRVSSLQCNKENEHSTNNTHINQNVNLPSLRNNNKVNLKNEYNLNLNARKKTYLNLCLKKSFKDQDKNSYCVRKALQTTRNTSDNILSTHLSGIYHSSRGEKSSFKSSNKEKQAKQKNPILAKHEISNKMRAKMIDWLLQISEVYKCKNQTLFLAYFIMDKYFSECERSLPISELHIIGVTCIFMACKYEQIHPLRIKTVVRDIAHNKIPTKNIINKEAEILAAIGYTFQRKCAYLICEEMISIKQNIIDEFSTMIPEDNIEILKKNMEYFLKLAAFDCNLFRNQNVDLLAKGILLAAIRSLPEACKNLELYDSFIQSCGKDYEKSHHICSQILFLHVNFKSEFGNLENISKLCPFKNITRNVSQSLPI